MISESLLEMPANPSKKDPAQFDYKTISDVILHIRYTAREGGILLRNAAQTHVKDLIKEAQKEAQGVGSVRLFSIRHEFPTEWAKFQSPPAPDQRPALVINLHIGHYPFWSKDRLNTVARVDILARSTQSPVPGSINVADKNGADANKDSLAKDPALGNLLVGKLTNIALPKPEGELKLFFDTNAMADLWIAIAWKDID